MVDLTQVEFVDEKEREYFARAKLGSDVEAFLQSDVGRYLHGRAKQEVTECQEQALDCNPNSWFGRRKLSKLQTRAATAENFMRWCADAIVDGRSAESQL
jgi:hypothetical protein